MLLHRLLCKGQHTLRITNTRRDVVWGVWESCSSNTNILEADTQVPMAFLATRFWRRKPQYMCCTFMCLMGWPSMSS